MTPATHATIDREDRPPDQRRSHPAAQALLAGLMQGIGEREKDEALLRRAEAGGGGEAAMRHSPAVALSKRQRRSIAAAIAAGIPIKVLKRSCRFPGVTDETMARIADEAGVVRKRGTRKAEARP